MQQSMTNPKLGEFYLKGRYELLESVYAVKLNSDYILWELLDGKPVNHRIVRINDFIRKHRH